VRRIIIICTALGVLVTAGVAYAALNSYTAKFSFSPGKAGSAKSPLPVAFTETFGAANAATGSRAAPLIDIKTTVYGLVANPKAFPTCSGPEMSVKKGDSFCPKNALVATGPVNALLGGTDLTKAGAQCNPFLHVWNAGGGKLWYFFTTGGRFQCAGLTTGQTAAYPGFIKKQGKNLVTDVPLPPDVSTKVANQPNLYGSLIKEALTFRKLTTKVKGKTVGFTSSVGCKSGKRPFSVAFTAVSGSARETKVVTGSVPCR
jgi:hypothetical protein